MTDEGAAIIEKAAVSHKISSTSCSCIKLLFESRRGLKEIISKCLVSANDRENDIDLHSSMDMDIRSPDYHSKNLVWPAFVI